MSQSNPFVSTGSFVGLARGGQKYRRAFKRFSFDPSTMSFDFDGETESFNDLENFEIGDFRGKFDEDGNFSGEFKAS